MLTKAMYIYANLKQLAFNYAPVPGGAKYLGNGQLSHPHFFFTLTSHTGEVWT